MNQLDFIRHLLSYDTIFFSLFVILFSFSVPALKRARFALYPVWYYLSIPIGTIVSLTPGFSGGLVRQNDPLHLLELTNPLAMILSFCISYSAIKLYMKDERAYKSNTINDIVVFIALASVSFIQAAESFRYSSKLDTVYLITTSLLPAAFLFYAWRQAGYLAPRLPVRGSSILNGPRTILLLGVTLKIIIFITPFILPLITLSGPVIFAQGIIAIYLSMASSVLIWFALALYERARYKFAVSG